MGTRERRILLAIVVLAIVVRLGQSLLVATISGDGPTYMAISRHLLEGRFAEALRPAYPPLYSAVVVGPYLVLRNWVLAGRATSLLFGVSTVAAMYVFTRRKFGAGPAMFVGLLLVFQPLVGNFSTRVWPSSFYTFLLICSLWMGLRALETQKAAYWLGCGCVAGLAYLTRPEALGVVMITGGIGLIMVLRSLRQRWVTGLRNLTVLGAGTVIVMLPYVFHMKAETGVWRLSRKKSVVVAVMSAAGMTPPVSDTVPTGPVPESDNAPDSQAPDASVLPAYSGIDGSGYLRTLANEIWLLVRSIGPAFLALIALALVRRRAAPREHLAELYLGITVLFYLLVYALFYASDRHLAPLMPLCVLWAGIGLHEITAMLARRASEAAAPNSRRRAKVLRVAVPLLVIASVLPFTFRPQDRDKICQKKAGLWLQREVGPGVVLLTDMSRLAYYAQAEQFPMKNRPGIETYDKLMQFIRGGCWNGKQMLTIEYLAVDNTAITNICHDFLDRVSAEDLIVLHEEPKLKNGQTNKIIVYRAVRQ